MQDFIYAQSQDFGELVSITPHLGDSAQTYGKLSPQVDMRESLLLELTLVTGALCTRNRTAVAVSFRSTIRVTRISERWVLTIRPPVTTALRFDDLGVYLDDQKLLLG
ncbi:hypothetical protein HCH54_010099 [Aspergillus fumigatus]